MKPIASEKRRKKTRKTTKIRAKVHEVDESSSVSIGNRWPTKPPRHRQTTLRFRRCRGNMIETFEIVRKIYDKETVPKLTPISIEYNRGHQHKLLKRV